MSRNRVLWMTSLAMIAFAANSLLCRLALRGEHIDAASFTLLRIASGALILWLIIRFKDKNTTSQGNWLSAVALFIYAAGFSFAYLAISAGVGALLLFGAVQATMIGYGLWRGERLNTIQSCGLILACTGLIVLMLPGSAAPPLGSAFLMVAAGIAWGIYSLRGKGVSNATANTAGNFMRALPFACGLTILMAGNAQMDSLGILYALLSGALASGLGYAIWYAALPGMQATNAATVQLSVPVLATIGAAIFLDEMITTSLVLVSLAILSGIAMVILGRNRAS